jgi:hypothetical protein
MQTPVTRLAADARGDAQALARAIDKGVIAVIAAVS